MTMMRTMNMTMIQDGLQGRVAIMTMRTTSMMMMIYGLRCTRGGVEGNHWLSVQVLISSLIMDLIISFYLTLSSSSLIFCEESKNHHRH